MRKPHLLKRNENSETVHRAIWFDTESDLQRVASDTIEHWLKFGWACYRERNRHGNWGTPEWFRFDTIDAFWCWVESKQRVKTKVWMFCHNTNFDLPILDTFRQLPKRGWRLNLAIIDGPPTVLRYRRDTCTLTLLDTLNIWRMPLAEVGEIIGMAKLPMPSQDASAEEWDTYGKRDVEVIMEACIKWWQFLLDNDMGGFAVTLASQSMRTFRHKYMKHPIYLDDNNKALAISRDAYHGGRCECFRIGKYTGEFYLLDIVSMYPWVMATKPVPTRLMSVRYHATAHDIAEWLKQYAVIARCRITIKEPAIAIVADDKLMFPIGTFDAVLTTPELQWVLEHGRIDRISEVAVYEQEYAFVDFVEDMYAKKADAAKRGASAEEFFFKKLVNSFYGKWGQRGTVWELEERTEDMSSKRWIEINHDTKTVISHRQFGGIIQRRLTDGETSNSFPAIAAHITAYARMALWGDITVAGRDNCYYCDTDSLLVSRCGLDNLSGRTASLVLGALKIEGSYNHVELFGCKDYVFDTKTRIKGIRKKALYVGDGTYEQERWSSLRGMLRDDGLERPKTRMVRKHLRRVYDKGVVQSDGRVSPRYFA